jgi:glutamine cyclotransferase
VRLLSFGPFAPSFTGGVSISAVKGQIVAATGQGGSSQVRVFDGKTAALTSSFLGATGSGALTVAAS